MQDQSAVRPTAIERVPVKSLSALFGGLCAFGVADQAEANPGAQGPAGPPSAKKNADGPKAKAAAAPASQPAPPAARPSPPRRRRSRRAPAPGRASAGPCRSPRPPRLSPRRPSRSRLPAPEPRQRRAAGAAGGGAQGVSRRQHQAQARRAQPTPAPRDPATSPPARHVRSRSSAPSAACAGPCPSATRAATAGRPRSTTSARRAGPTSRPWATCPPTTGAPRCPGVKRGCQHRRLLHRPDAVHARHLGAVRRGRQRRRPQEPVPAQGRDLRRREVPQLAAR